MPSSLNKVSKTISKKRAGKAGKSASLSALHENSRDAARIRRAAARDTKVAGQEKRRRDRDGRLLSRLAFFHAALASPLPVEIQSGIPGMHALVKLFIARHDKAIAECVAERRAGRPKSARHRALVEEQEAEQKEYEAGFWIVDIGDERNAMRFKRDWNGHWGGLGQFTFVRVVALKDGEAEAEQGTMDVDNDVWTRSVRKSGFPPTAGI